MLHYRVFDFSHPSREELQNVEGRQLYKIASIHLMKREYIRMHLGKARKYAG
jgi:DNA-binding CsgD family transcriptional regulator